MMVRNERILCIIISVTSYFTPILMSIRSIVGKARHVHLLRKRHKLVKSKKLCGGNATFVGLHEVGAYGNRHSLMPDLNGDEWIGCPKWLDEQC